MIDLRNVVNHLFSESNINPIVDDYVTDIVENEDLGPDESLELEYQLREEAVDQIDILREGINAFIYAIGEMQNAPWKEARKGLTFKQIEVVEQGLLNAIDDMPIEGEIDYIRLEEGMDWFDTDYASVMSKFLSKFVIALLEWYNIQEDKGG